MKLTSKYVFPTVIKAFADIFLVLVRYCTGTNCREKKHHTVCREKKHHTPPIGGRHARQLVRSYTRTAVRSYRRLPRLILQMI
jgi:hypothetical protein